MSNREKVQHVKEARESGVRLEPALNAVELARSTWYYHRNQKTDYAKKYEWLRPLVEEIIRENSGYGVPRIKRTLEECYGHTVNHKVLRRLLRMWDLSLRRNTRKPERDGVKSAIRTAGSQADLVTGMDDIEPFEVTVTDFTELRYAGGTRKAKLMPLIGHETKMVYGWALGPERNSRVAIRAWERAVETFQQFNICPEDMIVHHDRDSVYTSFRWLWRLLMEDGVRLSFAMRGAKDNTVVESFNGRFKDEGGSLFTEASNVEELRDVVGEQMSYYNRDRIHSSIDYMPPARFVRHLRWGEDENRE